ncbi:hypothetical protein G6O69_12520 [Pseudenhygromyxa sp. WMMC2535]|uniref:hypothetical protein n=1 Tax=Pseudenhygromyxa sp. WMMC2535 TaxID=2712867 RepID=UPI001554FCE7|nr:hypothetical protein [Pseudenhygromyxa sp. WMMC2535]NVB38657.1 hypothetical protein [Pseudenhygromyxa sp. WMMC2535]
MNTLWIDAVGMACPVGLYSAAALAAMRAGIDGFTLDEADFSFSRSEHIEPSADRTQRTLALMEAAFLDLLPALREHSARALPFILALGGPGEHVRRVQARATTLLSRLGAGTLEFIDIASRAPVSAGRASFMVALALARAYLEANELPFVVVGTSDSLVDPASLEALDARKLLLSPNNPDGRIPGEAAVFLLVSKRHSPRAIALSAIEHLEHPESFAAYSSGRAPAHARGLTELFGRLGRSSPARVDGVFSGQPHGEFWGREFCYAYLRNARVMPEPLYHRDVGSELGDVGAAAGAVAIMQAIDELRPPARLRPYMPARERALVYAVSDRGEFGGCILQRTPAPRDGPRG